MILSTFFSVSRTVLSKLATIWSRSNAWILFKCSLDGRFMAMVSKRGCDVFPRAVEEMHRPRVARLGVVAGTQNSLRRRHSRWNREKPLRLLSLFVCFVTVIIIENNFFFHEILFWTAKSHPKSQNPQRFTIGLWRLDFILTFWLKRFTIGFYIDIWIKRFTIGESMEMSVRGERRTVHNRNVGRVGWGLYLRIEYRRMLAFPRI